MTKAPAPPDSEPEKSSERVYRGIMRDLEEGRMVPGQILAETSLAVRFGVGRNAVREAMQQLAARGVVDLSRNRSPTIRLLDAAETFEILDVACAMTVLAAEAAARRYNANEHVGLLAATLDGLVRADFVDEPGMFSQARRHFYRVLLEIGANRELQRLFPAIGMHIIYAQFQSKKLRGIRLIDYRDILDAVASNSPVAAGMAGRHHVDHVRKAIEMICG